MIRINLLPVRAAKKKDLGLKQLTLLVLLVVGALLGNYLWLGSVQSELATKKNQVAKLEQDIAQLEKIIGEVNTIAKQKKTLEDKLAVLAKLRKGRSGPVKMMDALATLIPEKVWITSLEEKGGAMTIKGGALTNQDLADLMTELKKSPYFSEPSLKRSVQARGRGRDSGSGTGIQFELSCKINYTV